MLTGEISVDTVKTAEQGWAAAAGVSDGWHSTPGEGAVKAMLRGSPQAFGWRRHSIWAPLQATGIA